MADDGGSTGVLRDELGVLPPGDVRQCLVALSDASAELRDLFNFRFDAGSLEGHSFGNLFLSAVEKMTNNFGDAVRVAGDVLRIKGQVIPITLDDVRLAIRWNDGTTVHGEGRIDIMHFVKEKGLPELYLEPQARLNPPAEEAIRSADMVVVAPGDLYTSLGPLLAVEDVGRALRETTATIVYVANLVVKPGQTSGFTVSDHAAEVERLAGSPILDCVLYNTAVPSATVFKKYAREGELLVEVDTPRLKRARYRAVGCDLLASRQPVIGAHDRLAAHRSFIRHDTSALATALLQLL